MNMFGDITRESCIDIIKAQLETLANLEHVRFASIAKSILDDFTPENVKKWEHYIDTPYFRLTEDEKAFDRYFAQSIIDLIVKVIQ